eukprot:13059147-Alexandrium_andersonii.AAC.1
MVPTVQRSVRSASSFAGNQSVVSRAELPFHALLVWAAIGRSGSGRPCLRSAPRVQCGER